jgi:hypothetical protein
VQSKEKFYSRKAKIFLSETRHVFEELAELLSQENITKLQPKRSINKLLDEF